MEATQTLTQVQPDKIEQALAKENVTERVIAQMKEAYMPLTINGIEDTKGYKQVDEARKKCKATRVLAEKICKAGREDAIKEQKAWIAKEKEVTGQIAEIEEHLAAQQKAIDEQKEAIRLEEQRKEQEKINARHAKLTEYGASLSFVDLMGMTDEQFEQRLAEAKAEHEKKQAEAAELERLRKEEAERLERERLEAVAKQKAEAERIERERAELERQQAEMKAQQEEIERKQREEVEALAKERASILQQRTKNRCQELFANGLLFNGDSYVMEDINVHTTEISTATDDEWNEITKKISPRILAIKEERAAKELERLEAEKQQAIETERLRIEQEQREKEEAEAARVAEEVRQAALRPDKEKLLEIAAKIETIPMADMDTIKGKALKQAIQTKLSELAAFVKEEVSKL